MLYKKIEHAVFITFQIIFFSGSKKIIIFNLNLKIEFVKIIKFFTTLLRFIHQ